VAKWTESGEPGDNEAAEQMVKRITTTPTPGDRIKSVKTAVLNGKAFFYPASAFDWQPILDDHDKYSTFIYCDWAMNQQEFMQGDHTRWQTQPVRNEELRFDYANALPICTRELGGIEIEMSDFLTADEQQNYRRCYDAYANEQPWGRLLDVTVVPDNRKIQLVFLGAEGVKTYLELFSVPRSAPQFLCIKGPGTGFGFNWTDFAFTKTRLAVLCKETPANLRGSALTKVMTGRGTLRSEGFTAGHAIKVTYAIHRFWDLYYFGVIKRDRPT